MPSEVHMFAAVTELDLSASEEGPISHTFQIPELLKAIVKNQLSFFNAFVDALIRQP